MKLITRHTLAAEIADYWQRYFPTDNARGYPLMGAKLRALGSNPDPETVETLLGTTDWTQLRDCTECGAEEVVVVQVGEEDDYESSTAWLCEGCLEKALRMIRGETEPTTG